MPTTAALMLEVACAMPTQCAPHLPAVAAADVLCESDKVPVLACQLVRRDHLALLIDACQISAAEEPTSQNSYSGRHCTHCPPRRANQS